MVRGIVSFGLDGEALFLPDWSRAVMRLIELTNPPSWLPAFAAYAQAG